MCYSPSVWWCLLSCGRWIGVWLWSNETIKRRWQVLCCRTVIQGCWRAVLEVVEAVEAQVIQLHTWFSLNRRKSPNHSLCLIHYMEFYVAVDTVSSSAEWQKHFWTLLCLFLQRHESNYSCCKIRMSPLTTWYIFHTFCTLCALLVQNANPTRQFKCFLGSSDLSDVSIG